MELQGAKLHAPINFSGGQALINSNGIVAGVKKNLF